LLIGGFQFWRFQSYVQNGWSKSRQILYQVLALGWQTTASGCGQGHVTRFLGRFFDSRPNKTGLKCPSVRPSTKRFLDFSEIWLVGRGRWVMHDGMQYDPIQGQGHEPFKVVNLAIFKCYLCRLQWKLTTDHGFLY